ncbi:MAG: hypothetical protein ACK4WJ_00180, partial [Endomicrobiia bacterium]
MKYYRVFLGIFILSLIYVFIKSKSLSGKIFILEKNIKVSTSTINIPFEFVSFKDSANKIKFYFKQKQQRNFLFPEHVLVLKKGQKYNNEHTIKIDDIKKVRYPKLYVSIEEVWPTKKIKNFKVLNKKQIEKIVKFVSIKEKEIISKQEIQTNLNIPTTSVKEGKSQVSISTISYERTKVVEKEGKVVSLKEKPDFEIYLSTEEIKNKYFLGEILSFGYYLINKNKTLSYTAEIDVYLKDTFDTIVATQNYKFSVIPDRINEKIIHFELPKDISLGEYYIQVVTNINEEKNVKDLGRFFITDLPPKISLTEKPTIKYKMTNTILVEVRDDRGVRNVFFIEIDPKSNQEKKYSMLLIAG